MIKQSLKIFHTAAAVRNFTETAAILGMTQPNVTQQIAGLEKELGVSLFLRTGRNVELTQAGEIFRKECSHLFELEKDILRKLRNAGEGRRTFILGGTMTAGSFLLTGMISSFQKENPDTSLHLKISSFDTIRHALAAGEMELALTEEPYDPEYFFHCRYCTDRLVPVFASGFVKKRFSLKEYLRGGGKLILNGNGSGERVAFSAFLREKNIPEPDAVNVTEVNSSDAVKSLAQSACGVAVMSDLSVENEVRAGILTQGTFSEGEIVRNMDFIYLPDGDQRFIENFIRFSSGHKGLSLR